MIARLKAKSQINYVYFILLLSGWLLAFKFYSQLKILESDVSSSRILVGKSGVLRGFLRVLLIY